MGRSVEQSSRYRQYGASVSSRCRLSCANSLLYLEPKCVCVEGFMPNRCRLYQSEQSNTLCVCEWNYPQVDLWRCELQPDLRIVVRWYPGFECGPDQRVYYRQFDRAAVCSRVYRSNQWRGVTGQCGGRGWDQLLPILTPHARWGRR